jgi:hypothetical protein
MQYSVINFQVLQVLLINMHVLNSFVMLKHLQENIL